MWLVELYKAKEGAGIQGIYSANSCDTTQIGNYIELDDYEDEIELCDNWNYPNKKAILILKKVPGEIIFGALQNERFMSYRIDINYNSLSTIFNVIYLEYFNNPDFFIEFYVCTQRVYEFTIPPDQDISSAPNPIIAFLEYLRDKTLEIRTTINQPPKYSITFDDNCKYYYRDTGYTKHIYIIKKPFLFDIFSLYSHYDRFHIRIYMKPRLIEDFNQYSTNSSTYNPDHDQPLRVDDIVNQYFDSNTKQGRAYNNVNINNTAENFRYNLIRSLLGTFQNGIDQYYFIFNNNPADRRNLYNYNYMSLAETPLCIYFPLFRPRLDDQGFARDWPQYDPNDTTRYMRYFRISIKLQVSGQVLESVLNATIANSSGHNITTCVAYTNGHMPSWRSDNCDLTKPFRFVGTANCTVPDDWLDNTRIHNANYLFLIVKPSANLYDIKGVGCNELTTNIYSFSNFQAATEFRNSIDIFGIASIQRITFSASGYPIDDISNTLDNYGVPDNETCFVLFNESLVENESDFLSIYQAVTSALPNSVVCYIGSNENIPNTHRNKVIHSDAIVTDLDTNEQMPLVIKYIRYAKRLHKLFNG